ncbi:prepilin-type N-terminal cleavage/methylation domain-containing protein [Glaciihabitans tibetensis]|uniref:alpha-amylase n=1 Tax=Glaciihabitans tibetensis TaxID=1266600 RepID=A0A2T0VBU0_9MICO|nr:carboxypeptidase-like regulatory domain-containing protein [Glaciihabitans tibetensis]PRY67538.1 prepilin-type N-terminal cleavage/methylation domain-containing protein [Glaciihabitans tibetensis]
MTAAQNTPAPPTQHAEQPEHGIADDAGFSLVEVMVALFVFALLSTGTAYTVLSVIQLDRDSRARHVAANLAAEEIDLARDAASVMALTDVTRPAQRVGGDLFHVVVKTAWVSATGTDDACGATGGTLLYKRINVEVRWDNQRGGSSPVRADTVITPNSHLNSPDSGTILVRVLGTSGSGVSGVGITATPSAVANGATSSANATTDSQGCAFLTRLTPGNYSVTATAADHFDSMAQASSPVATVPVVAGYSAGASFSYDRASQFTLTYAPTATPTVPAGAVYLPRNLDTSYLAADGRVTVASLTGSGTNTTRTLTASLFPFASGYEVIAGVYTADASCLSIDPAAWAPVTEAGVVLTGTRTKVASSPGESVAGTVPMGILTVTGLAPGANLTAVSAAAPASTGDPGCTRATTYAFGAVPSGSTIALPFGSWTLHSTAATAPGAAVPGSTVPGATVPGSAITLGSRGSVAATVITLDPRVAP